MVSNNKTKAMYNNTHRSHMNINISVMQVNKKYTTHISLHQHQNWSIFMKSITEKISNEI